jgi:hypothetical protein
MSSSAISDRASPAPASQSRNARSATSNAAGDTTSTNSLDSLRIASGSIVAIHRPVAGSRETTPLDQHVVPVPDVVDVVVVQHQLEPDAELYALLLEILLRANRVQPQPSRRAQEIVEVGEHPRQLRHQLFRALLAL